MTAKWPGVWADLTNLAVSPWDLALRAVVVYVAILVLLRIGGKRQLGQMGPTEFVAILLISNAVQNAMNGGDNSLVGGLWLASILIFMSWLISLLTFRSRKFSMLFEGTPTLLIHKGEVIEKNLTKERITHNELRSMLRRQGIQLTSDIQTAILEADGALSITHKAELAAAKS